MTIFNPDRSTVQSQERLQNDGSAQIVQEYARGARGYDARWRSYVDATTRETIRRLPLASASSILDVGCGTGELLHRIGLLYPALGPAGADPVAEMLTIANAKLSGRADLKIGWANQLPWQNESFDVVVSCNMFHYITHPSEALKEMVRVLRPGGALVITDWCDDFIACQLCSAYLRLTSRAFFKIYRRAECLQLLNSAGVREARIERYKINWIWGLMTASATKAEG